MFSVIILAAGAASRMGGVDKQFAAIGGTPVFIMSAQKFAECPRTAEIIIAAPENERERYSRAAAEFGVRKLKAVVAGGKTRFGSVKKALAETSAECDYIAIHDGARPLIEANDIERVFDDAEKYGAAIAAIRAVDTVKTVGADGFIENTPPRERLFYAQTPQAFRRELYISCAEKLGDREVTDDGSVLELCGERVKITELSGGNMKITRPDDLAAARAIFENRRCGK